MPETKALFSGSMFFEFSFSDEPLSPEKYQSRFGLGFPQTGLRQRNQWKSTLSRTSKMSTKKGLVTYEFDVEQIKFNTFS